MKNKNIDSVKMTRLIRDKFYEQHKNKSLKEFTRILIKEAHESSLWKNPIVSNKTKTSLAQENRKLQR